MKPRPRSDTRLILRKPRKSAGSLNFFQGRGASAYPEWGAEITRFRLARRRTQPKG